jgi:thiamine-monophosphate kinase
MRRVSLVTRERRRYMKLSELGEFGLISKIRKSFSRPSPRMLLGIGDDAAALRIAPSRTLLATTDMLLEGVHFDLALTDPYSLGWKSAAVNISDIAAMGGIPRFCLISLGIPAAFSVDDMTEFYRGFDTLARIHGCLIAGGDTCASRKDLVVSITVLGESEKNALLPRSGARPGDRIFVTGTLGDSAAGLALLRKRSRKGSRSGRCSGNAGSGRYGAGEGRLIRKHLRPEPRVAEGRSLARARCASSLIDVSDGLSSDLLHICEESGVGAEIYADAIPLSADLLQNSRQIATTPRDHALSGGEDYELLFTVPERKLKAFRSLGLEASEIGVIRRKKGAVLVLTDGRRTELPPKGYDHFRRR